MLLSYVSSVLPSLVTQGIMFLRLFSGEAVSLKTISPPSVKMNYNKAKFHVWAFSVLFLEFAVGQLKWTTGPVSCWIDKTIATGQRWFQNSWCLFYPNLNTNMAHGVTKEMSDANLFYNLEVHVCYKNLTFLFLSGTLGIVSHCFFGVDWATPHNFFFLIWIIIIVCAGWLAFAVAFVLPSTSGWPWRPGYRLRCCYG